MPKQIVSLAILEALPGKADELLATLRELYSMISAKGYARDILHRDVAQPHRFVHVRYWTSAELRLEAQNDPAVHRYWQKLPELCIIPTVFESLERVFESEGKQ